MLDRQLVEDVANRIRPGGEGLIEKDWQVVRAIGVLAALDHGEARPVLEASASASSGFAALPAQALMRDGRRGGGRAPAEPADRFSLMLEKLGTDPLWAEEYEEFVHNVSFAAPAELIPFATALASVTKLAESCISQPAVCNLGTAIEA